VEPLKRAIKFSANAKYKMLIVGDAPMTMSTSVLCGA